MEVQPVVSSIVVPIEHHSFSENVGSIADSALDATSMAAPAIATIATTALGMPEFAPEAASAAAVLTPVTVGVIKTVGHGAAGAIGSVGHRMSDIWEKHHVGHRHGHEHGHEHRHEHRHEPTLRAKTGGGSESIVSSLMALVIVLLLIILFISFMSTDNKKCKFIYSATGVAAICAYIYIGNNTQKSSQAISATDE
jgi:hypothetical protein